MAGEFGGGVARTYRTKDVIGYAETGLILMEDRM